MRPIVRLCLLVLALGALFGAPAQATRVLGLPETLTSQHFQIHYAGQVLPPGVSVIHQDAADLAGNLEQAYSTMVGDWGYPAPLDDGDGKIDVFVVDLSASRLPRPRLGRQPERGPELGYLYIDDNSVHDLQVARATSSSTCPVLALGPDGAVRPGSECRVGRVPRARLPAHRRHGSGGPRPARRHRRRAGHVADLQRRRMRPNRYENNGYSRWSFYEYLTERYGGSAVFDLFQKGKTLNDPSLTGSDLLIAVLQDKGATLGDMFGDFTITNLSAATPRPG